MRSSSGLAGNHAADINFIVLPVLVALAALLMAGLAVPLGRLLTSMPPLQAYAWDISGSMAGIAAFTLLSALGTPPLVWFLVFGALLGLGGLSAGLSRSSVITAATFGATIAIIALTARPGQIWSPYYRIDTYDSGGIEAIDVNGIPHQGMWPVDRALKEPMYGQVYDWFPDRTFGDVLIIGAGSRQRCRRCTREGRWARGRRGDRPGHPGYRRSRGTRTSRTTIRG